MCYKCDLVVTCLDQAHDMEQAQAGHHQKDHPSISSLSLIEMLCKTAQAPICRFHRPKVCSMATLVLQWALLNASSFAFAVFGYGVMRNGLHG